MSYTDTKQALITRLLDNLPSGLTSDDVAFENHRFDPSNKDLWLAAYFRPASTEPMGKASSDCDEQRGIFQVSVFSSINNGYFGDDQLKAVDSLVSSFRYNEELVYNTQTVWILESTVNNGSESESWFQCDLSINYLTFSTR